MVVVATLVVTFAAVLHVGIFIMESVSWTRPAVWKRFRVASQADADLTRPLAYNQGFYNLFLAIGAVVGVAFVGIGWSEAGLALVVFTMGSMLAASVVLVTTGRGYLSAALMQGTLPLIGLVLILLA
jgi:putative membrane protein